MRRSDFLWSRPFRELTITELMESTGVSRSAFYQYFAGLPEVMQALQDMLLGEIFAAVEPWLVDTVIRRPGARDLAGLVRVCHQEDRLYAPCPMPRHRRGLRRGLEPVPGEFDDAVAARIEADQAQGLIPDFEARPVAVALNRLDASTLIHAFGQHPRMDPEPVREAISRIWTSTLYGIEWVETGSSNLVRT